MTTPQKVSFSLFITVLLFAAFAVLAFSGLFDFIETRFYNPAVTRSITRALDSMAAGSDGFHASNTKRFEDMLSRDFVKRSFLPNISSEDLFNRNAALTKLQEEVPGLVAVRFVDQNGKRIHYSTLRTDVKKADAVSVTYMNYGEAGEDYPYDSIAIPDGKPPRILASERIGGFLYAFPFYDSFNIYKGTALFSVSATGLASVLIRDGAIAPGDDISVLEGTGVVLRMPQAARDLLSKALEQNMSRGSIPEVMPIAKTESGNTYYLFNKRGGAGLVGIVSPSSLFAFPVSMKAILLASFFLTVFLLSFLLFNLRQDQMVVLSDRVKRFQINLLEGYLENKGDIDWQRWQSELAGRRDEVKKEIKRGIGRLNPKKQPQIDELIDKSWDEILAVMGAKYQETRGTLDVKQLEEALKKVLGSGNIVLPTAPQAAPVRAAAAQPAAVPAVHAESNAFVESSVHAEPAAFAESAPSPVPVQAIRPVPVTGSVVSELEELPDAEEIEELEEVDEEGIVEKSPAPVSAAAPRRSEAPAETVEELESVEELEVIDELESVSEAESGSPAEASAEPEPAFEADSATGIPSELESVSEAEVDAALNQADRPEAAASAGTEPLAELEPEAELETLPELEGEAELESVPEEPGLGPASPAPSRTELIAEGFEPVVVSEFLGEAAEPEEVEELSGVEDRTVETLEEEAPGGEPSSEEGPGHFFAAEAEEAAEFARAPLLDLGVPAEELEILEGEVEELDTADGDFSEDDIPVIEEPIGIELVDDYEDASDLIALIEEEQRRDIYAQAAALDVAPEDESSMTTFSRAEGERTVMASDKGHDQDGLESLDEELQLDIAPLDLSGLEDYDEETEDVALPEITPVPSKPEVSVEDDEELKKLDRSGEIPMLSPEDIDILEELNPYESLEPPVELKPFDEAYSQYVPFFARPREDFAAYRTSAYEETGAAVLEEFAELEVEPNPGDALEPVVEEEVGDEPVELPENGPIVYEDGVYRIRPDIIKAGGPEVFSHEIEPGFRELVESVLDPDSGSSASSER
jgi:hypothetical protein